MLIATGRIETNPSVVHELLADLRAGIARSLEEDGCHFYSFAMEDAANGHILTLQLWRDEASLAAHLATRDIGRLVDKWTGRFTVHTKLYDAENERAVGAWNDPTLERVIQAGRAAATQRN